MSQAVLRRRGFLKKLGAAAFLAVPVFRESLARAQAKPPLRLILLNLPGGIPFKAKSEEQLDTYFDSMFKPFESLQSDMIVFDRIQNKAGDLVSTYWELEGHGGGCRSIFGGAVKDQGCMGTTTCGAEKLAYRYGTATTIDQTLAKALTGKTPFDALHVGTLWDKGQGGDHAECFYNNGQAVRPIADPMVAFSRLFANRPAAAPAAPTGAPAGPDPALLKLFARGKSRLDALAAEVAELKALAGPSEQAKLDQHLTALRELERKLPSTTAGGAGGGLASSPGTSCAAPTASQGGDIRATSAAFNDIAFQAINCDLARIVAMQWLSSGDHLPRFGFLGLKQDHHAMEHSMNGAEYIKAQLWILDQMAAFVKMLKATPEGNGSMLDNSIVYLASEMGNGTHILSPALSTIIGKAGGQFRTGRRIDAGNRNINDVLLTVVKTMGLNATVVGDPSFNKEAMSLS
jgi:hypothetical protein